MNQLLQSLCALLCCLSFKTSHDGKKRGFLISRRKSDCLYTATSHGRIPSWSTSHHLFWPPILLQANLRRNDIRVSPLFASDTPPPAACPNEKLDHIASNQPSTRIWLGHKQLDRSPPQNHLQRRRAGPLARLSRTDLEAPSQQPHYLSPAQRRRQRTLIHWGRVIRNAHQLPSCSAPVSSRPP